jgi:hypothetical protein
MRLRTGAPVAAVAMANEEASGRAEERMITATAGDEAPNEVKPK